jgi:hypothetical protein
MKRPERAITFEEYDAGIQKVMRLLEQQGVVIRKGAAILSDENGRSSSSTTHSSLKSGLRGWIRG